MNDLFSLDQKTALITGASRGIGRSIARAYARQGATVVLCSRNQEALESVANEIKPMPGRAIVIPAHVGRAQDIDKLLLELEQRQITVDVLVNNAATSPISDRLVDTSLAAWQKIMDINLTGPFLLCRAIGGEMAKRGHGSIINISSAGSLRPLEGAGAYCVSKAALNALTKSLAKELGPFGVRVNAIVCGIVETKMSSGLRKDKTIYDAFIKNTPLRRHAKPEEVTGAALYLASSASSYTTGDLLSLDGGTGL